DSLETPVSLDEVKKAVWDYGSFKAPGPDGFSFAFVKIYWDDKVDILKYVNIFLDTGVHYKIIAKILANWLSNVIDKIVSHEQSAFIAGRQILDSPLILNFVLLNLGFGSKWRSWIRACLSSSSASVLVNGSPTLEFSIKHGLRPGDPLSPFLFILVMEGLHNALSIAVSSGSYERRQFWFS
ncbi:putative RNA-directed DNA polymerase, eukaryota, reverse transcriptase zinc-binding domain protein, partial [Tanacetum coccineum]